MSLGFADRCKLAEARLAALRRCNTTHGARPTINFTLRHEADVGTIVVVGRPDQRLCISIGGSSEQWAPLLSGLPGGLHRAWRRNLLEFGGDIPALVPYWSLLADLGEALRVDKVAAEQEPADNDRAIAIDTGRSASPLSLRPGPPVVLLHGAGQDRHVWDPIVLDPPAGYTWFAPDLPGHGDDQGPVAEDYANMCRWLSDYLAQRSLQRPILVGHSFSGMLALEFAIQHPESCSGVVIVNSTASARGAWPEEKLSAISRDPMSWFAVHFAAACSPRTPSERIDQLVTELGRTLRPDVMMADMRMFGGASLVDELSQLRVGVYVIHGNDDWSLPPQLGQALAQTCGGTFEAIVDAGHFPHIERPTAFRRVLTQGLASLVP